jgi:hypothetical protein
MFQSRDRFLFLIVAMNMDLVRQMHYPADVPRYPITDSRLKLHEFVDLLSACLEFSAYRSIIWLACRTCLEPSEADEYAEVAEAGFWKEFNAASMFV